MNNSVLIDDTIDQICSIQEVKDYLQIDMDQQNDIIKGMIDGAISYAELKLGYNVCQRRFQIETKKMTIIFDKKPFIDVVSVYKDEELLASSEYVKNEYSLSFKGAGNYRVVYTAGVNSSKISPIVKRAIIDHVSLMYNDEQSLTNLAKIDYYYNQFRSLRF